MPRSVPCTDAAVVAESNRSLSKGVYILMVERDAQFNVRAPEGEWGQGSSVEQRQSIVINRAAEDTARLCGPPLVGKATRASVRGQASQEFAVDTQS